MKNAIKIKKARFVGDYVTQIRIHYGTTVYLVGGCWVTIYTVASHWSIIVTLVDVRPNQVCISIEYIHLKILR